jgi:hypothetical protein
MQCLLGYKWCYVYMCVYVYVYVYMRCSLIRYLTSLLCVYVYVCYCICNSLLCVYVYSLLAQTGYILDDALF